VASVGPSLRIDFNGEPVRAICSPRPHDVPIWAEGLTAVFQVFGARDPVRVGDLARFPDRGNHADGFVVSFLRFNDRHGEAQVRGVVKLVVLVGGFAYITINHSRAS